MAHELGVEIKDVATQGWFVCLSVCLSVCLLTLNPPFAHSELRSVGVKRELGTNESVFRSAATLFTKSKDVKQGIQLPVYAEFRYPKFIELT